MNAARAEGLVERVSNTQAFARQRRVVLLRHAESGVGIDISLGVLPFEQEMVARSKIHQIEGLDIRLPTPEDGRILPAGYRKRYFRSDKINALYKAAAEKCLRV